MKILNFYNYMEIIAFADANGYVVEEYGNEDRLGMHFITLQDDKDNVLSFVYTGYNGMGARYMLAYSDLEK